MGIKRLVTTLLQHASIPTLCCHQKLVEIFRITCRAYMVNKMKEENMSGTVFFPWAESTETRSFTIIYVIYLWVGYDGAIWVKF